jgi:hypothetical protein
MPDELFAMATAFLCPTQCPHEERAALLEAATAVITSLAINRREATDNRKVCSFRYSLVPFMTPQSQNPNPRSCGGLRSLSGLEW